MNGKDLLNKAVLGSHVLKSDQQNKEEELEKTIEKQKVK